MASARSTGCWRTSTTSTGSTRTSWRAARALGTAFWKGGDQAVIDGAIVNGSWRTIGRIAGAVRGVQSGYIYHYAMAMLLGIFLLMTYFVWFNK